MKQILLYKQIIISVIVALGLVGSVYLYVRFTSNEKEKDRRARVSEQMVERVEKETKLKECIDTAGRDYLFAWNNNCDIEGATIHDDGSCSLPMSAAEAINSKLKEDSDRCALLYK